MAGTEHSVPAINAWAKLPEVLAGPRLTPALEPLMTPVAEKAAKLRAAGEDFFRVAKRLADEIADLKRTREQLVADIEAFHASAAATLSDSDRYVTIIKACGLR